MFWEVVGLIAGGLAILGLIEFAFFVYFNRHGRLTGGEKDE